MEETLNNSNKLKAVLFSLLVAVAGAVVWAVLYTEGWFVSIVAYAASFLMLKVYKKYEPNAGKGVYAYVLISIIALNCIASYIALVAYVADYYGLEFSFVFDFLTEHFSEFSGAFFEDMIFGALFAVLGVVSSISYDKKIAQQKQTEKFEKDNGETTFEKFETEEKVEKLEEEKETPKKKFCRYCGAEVKQDDTKCPSCGSQIDD